jgi:DNA-binding NtrC family response regulator
MAKVEASAPPERASLLLVDDEPAVLKVTQKLLERRGYQVVACNSAEEALTWLGREVFDVVLSDVQMPGIGGLGLLRAVHEQDARLPVILVTGNPTEESELVAKELCAFQYLTKPVAYEQLDEVVAQATNSSRRSSRRLLISRVR